ncbi:MAG: class I SAM-dependent methyltransferase [Acidiferrobacterales bacterium]
MQEDLNSIARKYSALYPKISDAPRRLIKGMKIAAVLKDTLNGRAVGTIVDIGCSTAMVLDVIVDQIRPVSAYGIDMDANALPKPTANRIAIVGDALSAPFPDATIDIVICNHTYEHVPSASTLFREIHRILVPGGIAYFGAMNARWPIEPHYGLPFIHWLPKTLSTWVLRRFGYDSEYLERPLTTARLRNLVSRFRIRDYTLKIIAEPERYFAADVIKKTAFTPLYLMIAKMFYGFLPGYVWVLEKNRD